MRFHGATPFVGTGTTDPDMAEYEALQEAWRQAKADRRRPYQHGYVAVRGTSKVAHVAIRGEAVTSHIRANADNLNVTNFLKSWDGVPGLMQGQPATVMFPNGPARQDMRRIPGGNVFVQAPERQVHVVEEHIDIYRQRVINVRNAPDQYVEHDRPESVHIGMDNSRVHVQQSEHVQVEHHQPKQSLLGAMLFGVKKPQQQQALPRPQQQYAPPQQHALPAPQAVDRGFLLPAPQQSQRAPQPLAISHQPSVPMEAPRKKSRSWI